METLFLILKKEWFDMIAAGIKKEEYRAFNEYWYNRLSGRKYSRVIFQHGYASDASRVEVECMGIDLSNKGNVDWGFDGECFVIRLGKIIDKKIKARNEREPKKRRCTNRKNYARSRKYKPAQVQKGNER